VVDERVSVRTEALERLVLVAPQMAATVARHGLGDPSPDVRAASIRVLGARRDPSDLPAIRAHSTDSAVEVKVAVAFALTRLGDDAMRTEIAAEIEQLARSRAGSDRALAAHMLGEVEPNGRIDRAALRVLLTDPDPEVVNAALGALHAPEDAELLAQIAPHLDGRETAGAAVDALVRVGDAALVVVDDGLRDDAHSRHGRELLVRASREIGGPSAIAVLREHIEHRDREVGLAVMRALATLGPSGPGLHVDEPDLTESVVQQDLETAAQVLRAIVTFENEPAAALQDAALRDELELARQRVLAALSMRHGTEGFNRVVFQLAQRDSRSHALALEWLDVTLAGAERAVVALLEPRWSDRERLTALTRTFPLPSLSPREVLLDLVQDHDNTWRRPWIAACALYTAAGISPGELDMVTAATAESLARFGNDDDGSIVHETLTGIHYRRLDRV
jgi:HEAT repeat protein